MNKTEKWEDMPWNELWEDGQDAYEVRDIRYHNVEIKGNWKLMRKKNNE